MGQFSRGEYGTILQGKVWRSITRVLDSMARQVWSNIVGGDKGTIDQGIVALENIGQ
jgi:hypothetical protein